VPKTETIWKSILKPTRSLAIFVILLLFGPTACTDIKKWAYEGFDRDEWQKPEEVIQALSLQPGDYIADLGSGSGYFTFRLADAVGPTGKVYAVDIDEAMNADLANRAQDEGYQNIEVVLAQHTNPGLQEKKVNLIFSSNTYHHLQDRTTYFANIRKYLHPQGRIAIIDFNGESWLVSFIGHYTPSEVIQQELQEAGYTLEKELDFLPDQAFLIFLDSQPQID
jgi:ubiquinone/menaquinone biosynthesis C-methylase UbiE